MAETISKCKYPTCEKFVNTPYDKDFCIYHAPKKNKGISHESFNRLISAQLKRKDFNFKGYIFPGEIVFPKTDEALFLDNAKFARAQFSDTVKFIGIKFNGYADFRGVQFHGIADFRDSQFSRLAVFNKAKFSKTATFDKTIFLGDADFLFTQFQLSAFFREAEFFEGASLDSACFNKEAFFIKAHFLKDSIFHKTIFTDDAVFDQTRFNGDVDFNFAQFKSIASFHRVYLKKETTFYKTLFLGETAFDHPEIHGNLSFSRAEFLNNCIFRISSPNFDRQIEKRQIIEFSHIIFNPGLTFFEDFSSNSINDATDFNTAVLFRYCNLNEAFFFKNDLSLFSFYNSVFDQARFISNNWQQKNSGLPGRKKVLLDEILFIQQNQYSGEARKKFTERYRLDHLNSFSIIAGLYHRMKIALENTKDFAEASWFHYNENEMHRLELREHLKQSPFRGTIPEKFKYYFLGVYKLFSGYGEKPTRSFKWFIFFAFFFFPAVHLANGLSVKNAFLLKKISFLNFDISFLIQNEFIQNFWYAVNFSLYRIIPIDILPLQYINPPEGPFGLFWSFINSIVLAVLAFLTAVGLKNRYRRS